MDVPGQRILPANQRRLEWARANLACALADNFTDVVWTDECSIMLESHRRHSFRKSGSLPKPKPRQVLCISTIVAYLTVSASFSGLAYTICLTKLVKRLWLHKWFV